jgi:hypothetical protein
MPPKCLDEMGHRYGRLTVIASAGLIKHQMRWVCQCICGRTCVVSGVALREGNTTSCGCKRGDSLRRHGDAARTGRSREYDAWASMKRRCLTPTHPEWPNYGGRGITVCDRWRVYEQFLADVGRCPPGHSLDRIDNDAGYEPGNVRWATPAQQTLNRRICRRWTLEGERISVAQMAYVLAMDPMALGWRLRRAQRRL